MIGYRCVSVRLRMLIATCARLRGLQLALHVADLIQQVQVAAALEVHSVCRWVHPHQLYMLLNLRAQRFECLQQTTEER
jgi:hypothetical protein